MLYIYYKLNTHTFSITPKSSSSSSDHLRRSISDKFLAMKMDSEELETTNSWHSTDLTAFTSHFRNHGFLLFTLLFCFLIFLLAFFFFYFVYKFTGGGGNFPASRPRPQPPPQSKGLDAESIQTLPAVEYVSLGVKEMSECSICLGLFEEVEIVKVMPECCHVFHGECVDTWLSTRPSCPLCRASLDSISVRISA